MKRLTSYLIAGMCIGLFGLTLATTADAQSPIERSFFNLTEPMDVGTTTLQPGDYMIRVIPNRWNRNILQVWSADEATLFTTLLSVPHPEGPSGVQIPQTRYIYYPATANHIKALRTWFAAYTPGSGGHDIVYPKRRAMELAALVKEPVVAIADEVKVAEYETAPLLEVTPEQEVRPYEMAATEKSPQPEPAPVEQVKMAEYHPPQESLPQTASDVPLHAGLGLLSLLGALGLGLIAKRLV